MPHPSNLFIYCDGGFGNRLNALFSGLALARELGLHARVFWPRNNWCQAGFNDIFESQVDLDERTLSQLAGTLDDCIPLLHDQLGADVVRVSFNSAYGYSSIQDFQQRVISTGCDVFYYPAVMPLWIPMDLVIQALQGLVYQPVLREEVVRFIQHSIGRPFYGLHLRRTDLGVGYSDEEVRDIVQSHPQDCFFVCSDEPMAEALAAVHANVVCRKKQAYAGRRNNAGGWTAQTADDDGRIYASNIDRNAASVMEAVVDLLILAHSEIVGFTGSTFQNIARLYGQHAPMVSLGRAAPTIVYMAQNTLLRQLHAGALTPVVVAELCAALAGQGRSSAAIELESTALEIFKHQGLNDTGVFVLHYNLAAHLLNAGQAYRARLYLEAAHRMMPDHAPTLQLLELARTRSGDAAIAAVKPVSGSAA